MHSDDESNPNQPEEESRTSHGCQPPIINSISFPFHRNVAVTSHQTFGSEMILQDNYMTRQSISREHAAVIRDWVSRPGLPSWSLFREMKSESVIESECGSIPRDRIESIPVGSTSIRPDDSESFHCRRAYLIQSESQRSNNPNKSWLLTGHKPFNHIPFSFQSLP